MRLRSHHAASVFLFLSVQDHILRPLSSPPNRFLIGALADCESTQAAWGIPPVHDGPVYSFPCANKYGSLRQARLASADSACPYVLVSLLMEHVNVRSILCPETNPTAQACGPGHAMSVLSPPHLNFGPLHRIFPTAERHKGKTWSTRGCCRACARAGPFSFPGWNRRLGSGWAWSSSGR